MSAARKVFHCAVDETALTTNISEIKKWATNGAITLIVPLYTLERLHALKKAGSQVAINAREAVRFLDRATSDKGNAASERVILQGPMEQFEDWSEAEKFFLPEFEEEPEAAGRLGSADEPTLQDRREEKDSDRRKSNGATDDLSRMLLSKLNFKKDPDAASATSTGTHSGPASRPATDTAAPPLGVLSPLCRPSYGLCLSALLWKLHKSPDASNAAKAPILVTNDPYYANLGTKIWYCCQEHPSSTIEIPTQPIDPNSFSRSLGVPSKQHATVDLSTQAGASRGFAGASRNNGNNRRGTSRGQTRGGSRGRGKLWVP
ncbi:uncharacterized protein ANIA_10400 [Aspergillus nidulans FGSC A4]|uniref:PIN domain-containing protein n=1 Tax=Emericella nidulans (strain FGSC A4 / ATCC 38163 / CBS 112.46 / NRRL 194 / M139) TaxID=227321 RepID=C8VHQ9_EMENI|nr:hypothetical protein [Aspergillus nidulans FGSC A4]CBF82853.1 TPA: conserved hypothetical protein [Aspergillus nidulans FGSC A4]